MNGSPNTITLTATGGNTYTLYTPSHIVSNANPPWSLSPVPPYQPIPVVSTATLYGSNGICSSSVTATFSVIPNPTLAVSNPTPVICAGETYTYTGNGAASYTWSATTPNYTTYSNGGVAVTNPSINSVFSVVGSSLGCQSALYTSSITVYPLPQVSVTPTGTFVCLGSAATLQALGNATSYEWFPAIGLNAAIGATVRAAPAVQQQYSVTGSLNCCTRTAVATVSVWPLPKPVATISSPTVCLSENVSLYGTGGNYYYWNGPNSINYNGSTAGFRAKSPDYSGEYTLTVKDANGCVNRSFVSLNVSPLPYGSLAGSVMEGCVPFCSDYRLNANQNLSVTWQLEGNQLSSPSFTSCIEKEGDHIVNA
jgi:hypothetical protein